MNEKPILLGETPSQVRPATPAEVINALNANLNVLRNEVQQLRTTINIWTVACVEVLDEYLPVFRQKFIQRRLRYDVREAMANRELNRRMGNMQAYRAFNQQVETLKKEAKEQKILSDFHKGERLYEKWKSENLELEDAPTQSNNQKGESEAD